MREPKFLFQSGNVMSIEKYACIKSEYPYEYVDYNNISELDVERYKLNYVPVGSVEFVRRFCDHVGLFLPKSLSYLVGIDPYIKRKIIEGKLSDATDDQFVKPKKVKQFTGDLKKNLRPLSPDTEVWISDAVPFESEFRFYIQDLIPEPKIVGWSRYDDLNIKNPDPDLDYINSIVKTLHDDFGPNAYTIDIGWRSDIQEYDIVELNDAWSLGLYLNNDEQTNSPKEEDYAQMLITRWTQILFCNIV